MPEMRLNFLHPCIGPLQENLSDALTDIQEACMGLLDELKGLQQTPAGGSSVLAMVMVKGCHQWFYCNAQLLAAAMFRR